MKCCRQCGGEMKKRQWANGRWETQGQMNVRAYCSKECRALGFTPEQKKMRGKAVRPPTEKIGDRHHYQCVVCESWSSTKNLHPHQLNLTCGRTCQEFLWKHKYLGNEEIRLLWRNKKREHKIWKSFVFGVVA